MIRYLWFFFLAISMFSCKKEALDDIEEETKRSVISLEIYTIYHSGYNHLRNLKFVEASDSVTFGVSFPDSIKNHGSINVTWSSDKGYFDNETAYNPKWYAPDSACIAIIHVDIERDEIEGEQFDTLWVIPKIDSLIFSLDTLVYVDNINEMTLSITNPSAILRYVYFKNNGVNFQDDEDKKAIKYYKVNTSINYKGEIDGYISFWAGRTDSIEIDIDKTYLHSGRRFFTIPIGSSRFQFQHTDEVVQNLFLDFYVPEADKLIAKKEYVDNLAIVWGLAEYNTTRTVIIEKEGIGDLQWSISSDLNWVSFPKDHGILLYPEEIEIQITGNKVINGSYSKGTIDLQSNNNDTSLTASFFSYGIYRKVCDGQIISEATSYNPNESKIHPAVIFINDRLIYSQEWWPSTKEEIELVVCVSTYESTLGTCVYENGSKIHLTEEHGTINVIEAKTGNSIYEEYISAEKSPTCPNSTTLKPGEEIWTGTDISANQVINLVQEFIEP
jgi:hypothetical protein